MSSMTATIPLVTGTTRVAGTTRTAGASAAKSTPAAVTASLSLTARRALAVLRLAVGFIFLWPFLDKTFGLGFATPAKAAWVNGGSPAQGFLNSPMIKGPFEAFFRSLATPLTDVLFMLGLLAVGTAVILGIGTRVAAVAGTTMMLLMYLAEWPFVANAGSTNPLVDYHIVYALALIAVAAAGAGATWGLGAWWARLPLVQKNRWLI